MQAARGVIFASKCSTATPPTSNKLAVLIENSTRGSNIQCRGRSFVASIPSDSSQSRRSQKRIPKHERRAMVESFVHRYRASNAGKFPTTSFIIKQIGGSYYVNKRILQELQHEYKVSPVDERDEFLLEKAERVTSQHFDAKDISHVSTRAEEMSSTVKHVEAASIHFEGKEEPLALGPCSKEVMEVVENTITKVMASSDSQLEIGEVKMENYPRRSRTTKSAAAPSKLFVKEDFASHQVKSKSVAEVLQLLEQKEDSRNDASPSKILQNSDDPTVEIIQEGGKEGSESQKLHRDISKMSDHKGDPPQKELNILGKPEVSRR